MSLLLHARMYMFSLLLIGFGFLHQKSLSAHVLRSLDTLFALLTCLGSEAFLGFSLGLSDDFLLGFSDALLLALGLGSDFLSESFSVSFAWLAVLSEALLSGGSSSPIAAPMAVIRTKAATTMMMTLLRVRKAFQRSVRLGLVLLFSSIAGLLVSPVRPSTSPLRLAGVV